MKPRLFIGSSSEELKLAQSAAAILEKEFDVVIVCRQNKVDFSLESIFLV